MQVAFIVSLLTAIRVVTQNNVDLCIQVESSQMKIIHELQKQVSNLQEDIVQLNRNYMAYYRANDSTEAGDGQ